MQSNRPVYFVVGAVVFALLLWTLFLIYALDYEKVFTVILGNKAVQIEALGQLGASYGVLASLFAGFAVVLLWQNIRVQQEELSELRSQMLHDRTLAEFTWLLNGLSEARAVASRSKFPPFPALLKQANGFPSRSDSAIAGHELIFEVAQDYLEKRERGDYFPSDNIEAFLAAHNDGDDRNAIREWEPLLPFFLSARQVAKYLFNQDPEMRSRLYPMFASSVTMYDMVVLHEKILIEQDSEFQGYVEATSLFSEYSAALVSKLRGGPLMKESAFRIGKS